MNFIKRFIARWTKSHWYAYTFRDVEGYKTSYMGYKQKSNITARQIEFASKHAKCVRQSVCMVNLSYLGYMTELKFNDGEYK